MTLSLTRILDRAVEWTLTSGIRMALVLGGVLVNLWLYRTVTRRLQSLLEGVAPTPEQAKRAATLTHIVRDVGVISLTVVAGMMVLAELGIDLKPILAAAGIGGLAVGFGAQSLVKDGTAPPLRVVWPGDGGTVGPTIAGQLSQRNDGR